MVQPHRHARRLQALVFPVSGVWFGILLVGFTAFFLLYVPKGGVDRGIGWMMICLPAIPGFVLSVLSWFFPRVRVWTCRQCGAVEEVPLSRSKVESGES